MDESDRRMQRHSAALGALARRDGFIQGDLGRCLRDITRSAAATLDVARASIWLFNDDRTAIRCVDLYRRDADVHEQGLVLSKTDFPAYFQALEIERTVAAEDARRDPRTSAFTDAYLAPLDIRAMLDSPILYQGRLIGVVCSEHVGATRVWTPADQSFSASLADFVALAMAVNERRETLEALRISEERLELAVSATHSAVWDIDLGTGTVWWSPQYYRMLGYGDGEIPASDAQWRTLIHPDDLEPVLAAAAHLSGGDEADDRYRATYRMRHRDGAWIWVEDVGYVVRDAAGQPERWIGIKADVTDTVRAGEALKAAEERYRSIVENAIEGLFQMTPDGRFLRVNPSMARLFGYDEPGEFLADGRAAGQELFVEGGRYDEMIRLLSLQEKVVDFEARVYRRDGPVIWTSFNVRAVRDDRGDLLFLEGSVMDVTPSRRADEQFAHVTLHDGLTNLPNRTLFRDRLTQCLARSRVSDTTAAVIRIDCDNFRLVNDSLGHALGDQLLIDIGQRLAAEVAPGDTLGRLAGDEFVALRERVVNQGEALMLAERLRLAIARPFNLGEQELFLNASVGLVVFQGGRDDPDDLLRNAGIAVHHAKAHGRGRCLAYSREMRIEPLSVLRLQAELRRAVDRDEFRLVYQPIVTLADRRLIGFEALVRWLNPSRGMTAPATFIPVAEESGLMAEFEGWVLRAACERLRAWQDRRPADSSLFLSINVSHGQLLHPNLFDTLDTALADTGADPRRLRLEVAETSLAHGADVMANRLNALRERGFKILVDDFGTGYSSLSRLHRFPIDGLKVDQSFVRPMVFDRDSAAIVRTVVALGKALELDVFAVGVEDELSAGELTALGCDYAQGYLFSRPVDEAGADALVNGLPEAALG